MPGSRRARPVSCMPRYGTADGPDTTCYALPRGSATNRVASPIFARIKIWCLPCDLASLSALRTSPASATGLPPTSRMTLPRAGSYPQPASTSCRAVAAPLLSAGNPWPLPILPWAVNRQGPVLSKFVYFLLRQHRAATHFGCPRCRRGYVTRPVFAAGRGQSAGATACQNS